MYLYYLKLDIIILKRILFNHSPFFNKQHYPLLGWDVIIICETFYIQQQNCLLFLFKTCILLQLWKSVLCIKIANYIHVYIQTIIYLLKTGNSDVTGPDVYDCLYYTRSSCS
jgi:hypothetical protein